MGWSNRYGKCIMLCFIRHAHKVFDVNFLSFVVKRSYIFNAEFNFDGVEEEIMGKSYKTVIGRAAILQFEI